MNEAEFDRFIEACVDELKAKQEALEVEHGLGKYARWDHDGELGTLTFSDPKMKGVVEAVTTQIGSYSLKTKTWMWSWANASVLEPERERASHIKGLVRATGVKMFGEAHFACDEYLAWELAAAAVHQLKSLGCYRAPMDHLWVFLSIDSIETVKRVSRS